MFLPNMVIVKKNVQIFCEDIFSVLMKFFI